MRWDIKEKRFPTSGSERIKTIYAFLPKPCKDGHYHWLERISVKQFWGSHSQSWVDVPELCICPDRLEGAKKQ